MGSLDNAIALQGRPVAATAPTDGQAVVWDAATSTWKPSTIASSGAVSSVDGLTGVVVLPGDGAAGTATKRSLGTSATQAAPGTVQRAWDAFLGAGDWIAPTGGSATTGTRPNGFTYAVPIFLPGLGIDQIGVEITSAGSAGSVHRFGVWSIGSNRVPTLIAEAATTLDSTSTTFTPVSITVPARTGWVWCSAIQQGAPATPATMRMTAGFLNGIPTYGTGNSVTIAAAMLLGSGTTGAIPGSYSALAANPNTNTNGPLIRARLA